MQSSLSMPTHHHHHHARRMRQVLGPQQAGQARPGQAGAWEGRQAGWQAWQEKKVTHQSCCTHRLLSVAEDIF